MKSLAEAPDMRISKYVNRVRSWVTSYLPTKQNTLWSYVNTYLPTSGTDTWLPPFTGKTFTTCRLKYSPHADSVYRYRLKYSLHINSNIYCMKIQIFTTYRLKYLLHTASNIHHTQTRMVHCFFFYKRSVCDLSVSRTFSNMFLK
jgi:hypothetical protein